MTEVTGMRYALDIVAAGAILICFFTGYHRGAVRTLVYLAGLAAAAALAVFVSNAESEYVYDEYVRPAVISSMEQRSEEILSEYASQLTEQVPERENYEEILEEVLTNGEIRDKINDIFIGYCGAVTEALSGVVPEEFSQAAEQYITGLEAEDIPELIDEDISAVELVEREVVRPVMLRTVKNVLFWAVFALSMIVVTLVTKLLGLIRKARPLKTVDGVFGGVLGIVQGVLIVIVICAAAEIFVSFTGDGNAYLNTEIIEQTYIFKRLYGGDGPPVSASVNR